MKLGKIAAALLEAAIGTLAERTPPGFRFTWLDAAV
jgi:hypothetical protein